MKVLVVGIHQKVNYKRLGTLLFLIYGTKGFVILVIT
jgi:hypothetical protein